MISESERKYLQVGYKQTLRALAQNRAKKVFLSDDCDVKLLSSLENEAQKTDAAVFYIPTMRELGALCGIDVGASCAVVLKD